MQCINVDTQILFTDEIIRHYEKLKTLKFKKPPKSKIALTQTNVVSILSRETLQNLIHLPSSAIIEFSLVKDLRDQELEVTQSNQNLV